MAEIIYKRATKETELQQILDLQESNLATDLEHRDGDEGFVTVRHRLDLLMEMNNRCPHFIAVSNQKVIGYALCMTVGFRERLPLLHSMFINLDSLGLSGERTMIMGQICIDKEFRKKGIFRRLYREMSRELSPEYTRIITEVDKANSRSLNAHIYSGFKVVHQYKVDSREWVLIGMDI